MRRASRIIVTSKRYADTSKELETHLGKTVVVPLGIDSAKFEAAERDAVGKIQSIYGPRFILAIGRLVLFKGFEILIKAMRNVPGNLVLVGDGPQRRHLEDVARSCNLSGRVFFTGQIDNSQIVNYLAAADIFAMPSISRAESFGIVQLEAMAAGLPVVNTNIESGVPEVSLDGITGITVPPGDSISLANALNLLLSDRELRMRMGNAGKDRVRSEFSIARMSKRTMQIYEEISIKPASQVEELSEPSVGERNRACDFSRQSSLS